MLESFDYVSYICHRDCILYIFFSFFKIFSFFFFFCLKGQPATNGKQMLSGVVSAGYSGYWTWKAGPGNKGLRSSSVVADEDIVFWRLRVDGDPLVRGCCVVFTGYIILLHYENISPVYARETEVAVHDTRCTSPRTSTSRDHLVS